MLESNMMSIILFPVLYDHVEREENPFEMGIRFIQSVFSALASAI